MEMVLRAAAIYFILLIIFKIAGRRTLMQLTNFDLILLLIISEATQQAMRHPASAPVAGVRHAGKRTWIYQGQRCG